MKRIETCQACNMLRNGVKSRIALEHTCGLSAGEFPENTPNEETVTKYFFDIKRKKIFKQDGDGNVTDISK